MIFRKSLLKDSFFDDINGNSLDNYQRKVVVDDSNYLLVVAAAGSGKTLTIVAKVKYLIEKKGFSPQDILCLSFTNETVDSLKKKVSYPVNVCTFHKLALKIIKDNNINFKISSDSLLQYVLDEYFHGLILNSYKEELLLEYFNYQYHYDEIVKSDSFIILKNTILSMIKKIKCNDLKIKDLKILKRKCRHFKDKILLFFTLDILNYYEEELLSEAKIDFDDMIKIAKDILLNHGIVPDYKYIIIDEYQDISYMRFQLVKEIIKITNAKLMCVGDDYQSIYGFSGSKVTFFLDFTKYFYLSKVRYIKKTYRNSYELINVTSHFILKNRYQLKKKIKATFLLKHSIVLVYYDNLSKTYNDLINYLYMENKKNIMVLARYNSDFKNIDIKKNDSLNIKYLTVHKSKGLECDNVILLKVSNDYLGFPSKIRDNYLSTLIDNFDEEIMYAEERRLFYVSLTRCRERAYILVPRKNPSIFIDEIKRYCVELLLK